MQKTFEKKIPAKKKQLLDMRKSDLESPPKKEIKKAKILNKVETSLAVAIADLIIQQNLS